MNVYEIRVLSADGKTSFIASEVRHNDNAAIRTAQQIFGGRKLEVWRGMDCIYGMDAEPLPAHISRTVEIDLSPP